MTDTRYMFTLMSGVYYVEYKPLMLTLYFASCGPSKSSSYKSIYKDKYQMSLPLFYNDFISTTVLLYAASRQSNYQGCTMFYLAGNQP